MKIAESKVKLNSGVEILLKTPQVDDAENLLEFMRLMYSETDFMAKTAEQAQKISVEGERKFLENMILSPTETMVAAYKDGKIIANCGINVYGLQKYSHRATLGISVLKEYWSNGVGSVLMEHTLNFAKGQGIEQVELTTVSENARAISLYKKFGFRQTGTIPRAQNLGGGKYYDYIYMVKAFYET